MRWVLIGFFALAAVIIVAVLLFRPDIIRGVFSDDGGSATFAEHCLKVTGAEAELGASIARSGKGFSSNLGLKEYISGSNKADIVDRVLDCVEKAFDQAGIENDYITRGPLQIGLVANQWTTGGMSLHLTPTNSTEGTDILNNLSFGPASGLRPDLIESWCARNSDCVSCEPNLGAEDIASASTVSISLKSGANAKKLHHGTAYLAGDRKHPWQLVEKLDSITDEGIGGRVIYECE